MAQCDGVFVGFHVQHIVILLLGVRRSLEEDRVIVEAQLLLGAVKAEVGGEHTCAETLTSCCGQLLLSFRNKLLGHHPAVDDVGIYICKDIVAIDLTHAGLYAAAAVAVKEKFLGTAVKPNIAAQLAQTLGHCNRKLMGGVRRYIRAAGYILVHHRRIVDERKVIHVNTQIRPVGGQDILRLHGQLECVKHLLGAVCAGAEHIGIVAL